MAKESHIVPNDNTHQRMYRWHQNMRNNVGYGGIFVSARDPVKMADEVERHRQELKDSPIGRAGLGTMVLQPTRSYGRDGVMVRFDLTPEALEVLEHLNSGYLWRIKTRKIDHKATEEYYLARLRQQRIPQIELDSVIKDFPDSKYRTLKKQASLRLLFSTLDESRREYVLVEGHNGLFTSLY